MAESASCTQAWKMSASEPILAAHVSEWDSTKYQAGRLKRGNKSQAEGCELCYASPGDMACHMQQESNHMRPNEYEKRKWINVVYGGC